MQPIANIYFRKPLYLAINEQNWYETDLIKMRHFAIKMNSTPRNSILQDPSFYYIIVINV